MASEGLSGLAGSVRERWTWRSEEPVRVYVPPREENVMALMGALCEVSVFSRCEGMLEVMAVMMLGFTVHGQVAVHSRRLHLWWITYMRDACHFRSMLQAVPFVRCIDHSHCEFDWVLRDQRESRMRREMA